MTATAAGSEQQHLEDFHVSLEVFDGPFDLLLNLIGKHELDITEVALSRVTDEFIGYVRELTGTAGMNRVSEFLVVAATLLDMKIASLLPQSQAVDAEDIALLEARDLLFARLLQYRAFKQASAWFQERLSAEQFRIPRAVPLDPKFVSSAPTLKWHTSPADFALLAAAALTPKQVAAVGLGHLHAPTVSIREQAAIVVALLRRKTQLTFHDLIAEVAEKGVVIARFLAVLELYRRGAVSFEQEAPLGDFSLRWVSSNWQDTELDTLGSDYEQ